MEFGRRLKLYLFGLIIGGVLAWLLYGERLLNAGWTPEARIKERIAATLLRTSDEGAEAMRRRSISLADVKAAIPDAEVILKETRRQGDSILYSLHASINTGPAHLIVLVREDYDRDSTATLLSLEAR